MLRVLRREGKSSLIVIQVW
jgi:hypothetical protein